MSDSAIPVQKHHISGSWRVLRSRAVPANVTAIDANRSLPPQLPESDETGKAGVEILLNRRRSSVYGNSLDQTVTES